MNFDPSDKEILNLLEIGLEPEIAGSPATEFWTDYLKHVCGCDDEQRNELAKMLMKKAHNDPTLNPNQNRGITTYTQTLSEIDTAREYEEKHINENKPNRKKTRPDPIE